MLLYRLALGFIVCVEVISVCTMSLKSLKKPLDLLEFPQVLESFSLSFFFFFVGLAFRTPNPLCVVTITPLTAGELFTKTE